MRRGKRGGVPPVGCLVILAGVLILFALILPTGFWWFALAVGLIGVGLWLLTRCR
ncbi:MAG TPA: hypothetical protein IAB77_08020 [Candidatus Scatomorpha intestinavium]|uniref:Uncharacterized protein n=1 Tax=Candidatus Scatomorpha intestinavium TaxID=2840922 RepID=A0A9D1CU82_9FIRM|nr:hypothetical protein [Candidatus Scatomorpha intestinavium]